MIGFIGILLGVFAIGVMQLILATALPFIVADIGGSSMYSWVFSSYMLASLATIPLFSKLADIYGKKKFYMLGMTIFALGCLYGGFTSTMPHLIIARIIQGLAAGIITPIAMAMITDMFPSDKRAHMIGMFGFVQLLSNLLSPPLGSFITKELHWQWIFFLVTVLIILSMLLVTLGGTNEEINTSTKISELDIFGALIFGGFCITTVSFSNTVSTHKTFGTNGLFLLLVVVILAVILILIEKRHKNPIIKVDFLQNKIIRTSIVSSILAGAIMYGLVTILPLCGLILEKQGSNVNESKILLLFMVGITTGLLTNSRLPAKQRSGKFTKILWLVMCLSSILLLYSIIIGTVLFFYIFTLFTALCTGGIMANFLINSQNAINDKERTVLSGIIQLGRYFGASIGVTILTGMLPEVSQIKNIGEFVGAFALLVALCILGLINELV